MGGYRGQEKSSSPQGSIHVARTVKAPQREFADFLQRATKASRWLLQAKDPARTHLTLLETRGVNHRMRQDGYTPGDVRQFRGDLERHLKDAWDLGTTRPCEVMIDPKRPLIWRGDRNDKLALNVIENENLETERWLIDDFLIRQFGEVPGKWPFEPHVTLGTVNTAKLSTRARRDPLELIPGITIFPETLALNGLMASFDRGRPMGESLAAAS